MNGQRSESEGVSAVFDAGSERAVGARANRGRWRLVAHQSSAALSSPYRSARLALVGVVAVLLVVLLGVLLAVHQFLARRISGPATELAVAAEAVAAGDFSVEIVHSSSDDEIGRLGRAVGAMLLELRRLAQALASSAQRDDDDVVGDHRRLRGDGGHRGRDRQHGERPVGAGDQHGRDDRLARAVGDLAEGARHHARRRRARRLGAQHVASRRSPWRIAPAWTRASQSLGVLGNDVLASAQAIESLGAASEEIRSFVGLVRKLARQSKLLALNAAMEAARAGEHGEGFAVVASEVRRLAAMSSDAAERTEEIVTGVLSAIQQSRESAARAVATAEEVRGATARATDSFTEIEMAVVEAEAWTASVEQTSAETSNLVARDDAAARVARVGHRDLRRRDGAGRRVEPGAERQHAGDRRRGRARSPRPPTGSPGSWPT